MEGRVVGRYPAAELKSMTVEQILSLIERDVYENAYDRQLIRPARYRGKNLAEHIELVLYLCPGCKKIGTIRSKGGGFSCGCGLSGVFKETGFLEGDKLPFPTILEWDRWQTEELAEVVRAVAAGVPICGDEGQSLYTVDMKSGNTFVGQGPMCITHDELRCAGRVFPLKSVTRLVVVDRMTLLFSLKDGAQYEVRSKKTPRSAQKYIEVFRVLRGEPDSE
jgi:hypothetical protein